MAYERKTILRHPNAPVFQIPPSNPDPTTTRGRRRSENTDEYQANCSNRRSQLYPTYTRSTGAPGPLRGPSKRATGCGRDEWIRIMTGKA